MLLLCVRLLFSVVVLFVCLLCCVIVVVCVSCFVGRLLKRLLLFDIYLFCLVVLSGLLALFCLVCLFLCIVCFRARVVCVFLLFVYIVLWC